MPKLYVATNGLSVWSGNEPGDDLSRMSTFTGMYSGSKVWALESHLSHSNELLAGTESGIYRLDQARMLWLHVPSPMDNIQVTALAIAPDDPDVIIAGTQPAALYRTDDGGKSWRKLSAPMKSHQMSPSTNVNVVTAMELGYASLRKDMAFDAPPVQKLYLAQRQNYPRDYEKWNQLANEVFRSGR